MQNDYSVSGTIPKAGDVVVNRTEHLVPDEAIPRDEEKELCEAKNYAR